MSIDVTCQKLSNLTSDLSKVYKLFEKVSRIGNRCSEDNRQNYKNNNNEGSTMKIQKYLREMHTMYLKSYMDSAAFEEHIRNEGIYQGKNIKLIEQVCQKLRKEKTLEQIADELEEALEIVERICKTVDKCGLEADAMEIYEEIQKRIDLAEQDGRLDL